MFFHGPLMRMAQIPALIVLLSLSGCVTSPVHQQSPESYEPVDIRKFASGMYPDAFFGKNVVVEGFFHSGSASEYNIMYSAPSRILFFVKDWTMADLPRMAGTLPSEGVPVFAPLSMRDAVYPLQEDQRIRVYGNVMANRLTSRATGELLSRTLYVRPDKIEVISDRATKQRK